MRQTGFFSPKRSRVPVTAPRPSLPVVLLMSFDLDLPFVSVSVSTRYVLDSDAFRLGGRRTRRGDVAGRETEPKKGGARRRGCWFGERWEWHRRDLKGTKDLRPQGGGLLRPSPLGSLVVGQTAGQRGCPVDRPKTLVKTRTARHGRRLPGGRACYNVAVSCGNGHFRSAS